MATLKGIDKKIDQIVKVTLSQYVNTIYREAIANAPAEVKSTFSITQSDNGLSFSIYSNNELAAYFEFGTGNFAKQYLSGKPQEMIDDALKFFINGLGTLPAKPYLYPVYYKYRDEIVREIDNRIQALFDRVKIR